MNFFTIDTISYIAYDFRVTLKLLGVEWILENFMYTVAGLRYFGHEVNVVVPHTVGGQAVRYLHPECFEGHPIESVKLPETLVEISERAFQNCEQLTSVLIPEGVRHIAGGAFQGCYSLVSIDIPASVQDIGGYAFDECRNLKHVRFNGDLQYIGAYAFSDTALVSITLPNGIKQLGNSLFFNCQQLNHVSLPSTVETIGQCAFAGCVSLTDIELPITVHTILDGAFEYCKALKSITFHSIPRFVHEQAFADCTALEIVASPIQADVYVELYHDKRYIFQHDPHEIQRFEPKLISFQTLFEKPTSIQFEIIEGPDYRLHSELTENILHKAQQLFTAGEYELCAQLLQRAEHKDELLLLARCYEELHEEEQALQTYKRYVTNHAETDAILIAIGRLVLIGTSLQDATERDYKKIGEKFTRY